ISSVPPTSRLWTSSRTFMELSSRPAPPSLNPAPLPPQSGGKPPHSKAAQVAALQSRCAALEIEGVQLGDCLGLHTTNRLVCRARSWRASASFGLGPAARDDAMTALLVTEIFPPRIGGA